MNPIHKSHGILASCVTMAVVGAMSLSHAVSTRAAPPDDDDSKTPAVGAPKGKSDKEGKSAKDRKKMPALQFKMKDIDGKDQDLRRYYGNVILIVNVATHCGFTPQYKGLQEMYDKYKDRGFVILAVPANEFGKQEPGSDSEIKEFCTTKFGVTFPVFSKVVVKGEGICPLYEYLTSEKSGHKYGGEIKWNFNKFLIDRKGRVVGRFASADAPESPKLVKAVESQLKRRIPKDSPLAEKKSENK